MYISSKCHPDCAHMRRDQGCREHPAKTGTEPSFPNIYISLASWDCISWRKKRFDHNYHFTWIISISFRQTLYHQMKWGRKKECFHLGQFPGSICMSFLGLLHQVTANWTAQNSRNFFFHGSGDHTSELTVLAELCSFQSGESSLTSSSFWWPRAFLGYSCMASSLTSCSGGLLPCLCVSFAVS